MHKNFHIALGNKIRGIRKTNKTSQESLAARCNLSINEIGRIERAERSPSLNTLLCICEGLETPISDLLSGIQESAVPDDGGNCGSAPSSPEDIIHNITSLLSTMEQKKLRLFHKILIEIVYHDV